MITTTTKVRHQLRPFCRPILFAIQTYIPDVSKKPGLSARQQFLLFLVTARLYIPQGTYATFKYRVTELPEGPDINDLCQFFKDYGTRVLRPLNNTFFSLYPNNFSIVVVLPHPVDPSKRITSLSLIRSFDFSVLDISLYSYITFRPNNLAFRAESNVYFYCGVGFNFSFFISYYVLVLR